jgi:hypothetical protein
MYRPRWHSVPGPLALPGPRFSLWRLAFDVARVPAPRFHRVAHLLAGRTAPLRHPQHAFPDREKIGSEQSITPPSPTDAAVHRHRQPLWPGSHILVDVVDRYVLTLRSNEVFVFGSNRAGFHGAGGAGIACRGDADCRTWRADQRFTAMRRARPGSDACRGRWAVFGVGSYAIETIERPGRQYRRGTPLRAIYAQMRQLVAFANQRADLDFVVTPIGEGLSGYTRAEMALLWRTLHERVGGGIPLSFRFVRLARSSDHSLT